VFQLCNPKHVEFHYDVRKNLVETIDGIVIYGSYHSLCGQPEDGLQSQNVSLIRY